MKPAGISGIRTWSLVTDRAEAGGSRAYVLVIGPADCHAVALPRVGELIIGRDPEADVVLDDRQASRRHARLIVGDGEIRIADLDSHNGVRVGGARVSGSRVLTNGDEITIAGYALVLHCRNDPRSELASIAELDARLVADLARARANDRPCAVIALDPGATPAAGPPSEADRSSTSEDVARALRRELREVDAIGLDRDRRVIIVAPELERADVERLAAALERRLRDRLPGLGVGIAMFPDDACDPATLLSAAQAAARRAVAGAPQDADASVQRLTLGDRQVLIADPAMARIYDLLARLGRSDLPVLIGGETGVGKEHAAYAVHHFSPGRTGPFIAINCAALQESLVESELFGHERGAFSGAVNAKAGLLEAAAGGTLFLDEVGELPLPIQAKLLRALETRRVTRVGAVRERELDLRLVTATNRDLEAEVSAGRFRRDLLFRINASTVLLPPLRERPREIGVLARAFLAAVGERLDRPGLRLEPAAMLRLASHPWPGNIRELRNVIERAAAVVEDDAIEPEDLGLPDPPARADRTSSMTSPVDAALPSTPGEFRPIAEELQALEAQRMTEALAAAGGVQLRAAALLGMPIRTFTHKLRQYGLAPRRERRS